MSSPAPAVSLLRPEVLAGLGNLDLVARAVVDGAMVGLHQSADFGFSQEFAEYRAYREGDDLRFVDWNVFARTGRTYLKQYRGETNAHLTLMIDASASMGFGSGAVQKIDCARYLAAALGYLARRQHDRVGMMVFDDKLRDYRPPRAGVAAFHGLLHSLEQVHARARTEFNAVVEHYCAHSKGAGLLAILSDFLTDPEQLLEVMKPLRALRTDVILFQILDPEELRPDLRAAVRYEDVETGEQINVVPAFMHGDYRQRMTAHIDAIHDAAARYGIDHILVDTSQPLDQALRGYLLRRQIRR
ncbi:MAG: DUF58 domain-containing protein [Gammaproteobacteria bacterium]|nr:DUF58 domain-containing protein [Gammaproteobacteria bacterium]